MALIDEAKKENIPFSAKMIVDYKEESNQIFDEAWKVEDEGDVGAFWGLWDEDGKAKYGQYND